MKRIFNVNGKKYVAEIEKGDKWYVAKCKELHSFSQGKTINSVLHNIREASELMLEVDNAKNSFGIRT